jgi:YfiH family protein
MPDAVNSSFPDAPAGFAWCESPAGRILTASVLSDVADTAITTRQLRFREPSVASDYDMLARVFGAPSSRIVRVQQVHGRTVLVCRQGVEPPVGADADAVVVEGPGLIASVRVADCVPVLVADRKRRVAAAIHAGWRGTAAGVSAETVRVIRSLGVPSSDLVAAIGPSIGPCCYQVSDDVRGAMRAAWPDGGAWFAADGPGKWTLDLWRANRDQLEGEGIPPGSIHVAGLCTADHPGDWYSHRREGDEAGRMVAAIGLQGWTRL